MGCSGCGAKYRGYQQGRRRMLQRRAVKKVVPTVSKPEEEKQPEPSTKIEEEKKPSDG